MTEAITLAGLTIEGTEASQPVTFGGERQQVAHKFPGGYKTIQDFGYLPIDAIIVKGIMFDEFAEVRSETFKALAANLTETELTWSRKKFKGTVHSYKDIVHHKFKIEYELEFWPVSDETNLPVQADTTDTASALGQALNDSNKELDFWKQLSQNAPIEFSPNVASDWEKMLSNLKEFRGEKRRPSTLPGPIVFNINAQINRLIRDISPIKFAGGYSGYVASNALNSLINLNNVLSSPQKQYRNIAVSNPNLVQLAAKYYGDPSKWTVIAKANGLGAETKPQGDFILKIPVET